MKFDDFIARFDRRTPSGRNFMVRCPAHEDRSASLSVAPARDGGVVLKCFAGCEPESVVGALGLTMRDLFAKEPARQFTPRYSEASAANGHTEGERKIEKIYSYTDALGREVFQVVRFKPKDFRQRQFRNGKWVWTMDGITRVLYRLPEVIKSETVWLVEGEKDADNLAALGFTATCNVGGAGKWLDGYTETLRGKVVVICGDNDKAGAEHVEKVFESVATKVKAVKLIRLPSGVKDISDLIDGLPKQPAAREVIRELEEMAVPHVGGVRMPVYSMAELEPRYHRMVTATSETCVDLGIWLPTLRGKVRPLTPGTLMLIVGDTGVGKTMLLQNIAAHVPNIKTLMFELELPGEDLFERFMANISKAECTGVEKEYRVNGPIGAEKMNHLFPNLFICPEPRMTIEELEAIVMKADLKMGARPLLVLLDYVQLMQGRGERYERTSDNAEALKIIAKATQTVIVVASQIARADGRAGEVSLHSAKDSGSLENSAGVVLGVWRDDADSTLMHLRVLKSTKGGAGTYVRCNFDGARSIITERAHTP